MTISKIAVYITLFLCFACESGKEVTPEIILPEPSSLEKILTRGSLEISTFYNTTDYYVYRGITRGFHYDLARDFAGYLGVNLRIVEVNNDIDGYRPATERQIRPLSRQSDPNPGKE